MNNTQRNMLDKLYTMQIDNAIGDVRRKRMAKRSELERTIIENLTKKTPAIAHAIELAENVVTITRDTASELEKLGLQWSNVFSVPRVEYRRYYDAHKNAELEAFDAETDSLVARMEETKIDMRLKINGSDQTYDEIKKEVEEALKGIA